MNVRFLSPLDQKPGMLAGVLRRIYAGPLQSDPVAWKEEVRKWEDFDREVLENPATVGACTFLTLWEGRLVGLASYNPRARPEFGIVGQNGVLPEFRGRGMGKRQVREILARFREMGIRTALVTTSSHPFFVPAQRMYLACGFREVRRTCRSSWRCFDTIDYEKKIT